MRNLYRVAVIFALWGCCVTAESQTPFYGYYDSGNLPGHGPPDNYTNQFAVSWFSDTAVADQALTHGQRLVIFHQTSTIGLDPNNPGSLANGLKISAYKWQPYQQAGVIDFVYPIDEPYSGGHTGGPYFLSDIETMVDLFTQNMPGYDMGLNFDAIDLGRPVFQGGNGVPTNLDFVGMTYYPYVGGSGPTNQAEFDTSFNPVLTAMRAEVTGSQQLYLIGQSFTEGGFTQPDDQSPHFYANALTTNSDVVGMQWFKYGSSGSVIGADTYPTLEAQIKDAGQNDLSIPTSPPPLVVPDYKAGLIDKWTFNNVSGNQVNSDGGAIGLTGTIHPGGELDPIDTQGGGNKGLESFNGGAAPDRIDFQSSHRYGEHSLDQLTIEAWVRQHGTPGKQAFVSKRDELFFGSVSGDSGNVFLTGGFDGNLRAPLTAAAWHHVAYVIEGTNGGGGDKERIYINGVEAASRDSQWTGITNNDDDLNIGFAEGVNGFGFRGVMDEVRIYDTALDATAIANSFTAGPEVPNPINLQTIYFEDFETGYGNGDPVTNKAEWTVGNATVIDSPGVLGGGTAPGLPDGHGLVLGGFVDTTENKVSFGDVTADKVYFSFDLYQTTDFSRGLTFDVVDFPTAVDTVYAIWNNSSTDVIDHAAGGVLQPFVDYDMPRNDWMHVEIVLDQVADTYDLMIGGELLLDDAGLQHDVTAADLISWSSHTFNGVFIDNILVAIEAPTNSGDFNHDGIIDALDIDLLRIAIDVNSMDPLFDINGGGLDGTDFDDEVQGIIGTAFGDADLNKRVTFTDFVSLTNNFGSSGTGWAQGNFNLDDTTNFADFVILSNNYGTALSSGVSAQENVPEPASLVLLFLVVGFVAKRRRGNG